MTDAVAALPAPAARPRGSFWLSLPIAVACIVLGHQAMSAVEWSFGGAASAMWGLPAFVSPFAAWLVACLVRRRWWSAVGAVFFPVALAALWLYLTAGSGCE